MKMRCTHCNGTGRSNIPKRLNDGLEALRHFKKATVAQVSQHISVELTATHRIVQRMVAAGLAVKIPDSSPAIYRPAKGLSCRIPPAST